MKKIISKITAAIFAATLFCTASFITSCDLFESDIETTEKAYISLGSATARTITPTFDSDNFSNFVLKGAPDGQEEKLIGSWDSLEAVYAELLAGTWNFTLTAKNGSAQLEGKLSGKAIISGNNVLNFTMDVKSYGSSSSYGVVDVSVNIPESVKCVKAGLFNVETEKAIGDYKAESLEITSLSVNYRKSLVATGTYLIKFFMYGDEEGTVLLNTYNEVVVVASEAISSGEETFSSVNSAYKIEYDLGKGSAKTGKKFPSLYSILTEVLLPGADDMDYPDHIFTGWYETEDFSGSAVTEIKAGTQTGNKKYYARWAVQGNFTLDVTAVASKIGELEADGAYTIKATGACSQDDILKIRNVLAGRSDIIVYLDLSATSGLTALATNDFQNCTTLYGVILPSSIKTMGSGIFAGCSNLTSITIPFIGSTATATTAASTTLFGYIFGTTAFTGATATAQYYSSSAATYYIPNSLRSVTVLGGNMLFGSFYGCTKLTTIVLPSTLTSMGNKGLYNCTNLKDFVIPSNLTTIGQYEFFGCSSITEIEIPAKVATIDSYAFQNLTGLKSVTFEEGSALTTLNSYAFAGCTSLPGLDFSGTTLTTIGTYAFSGCTSLASVNLTSGKLTTINTYAFQNCSALSSIVVPKTVKTIGLAAFNGCSGLTSMTLPFIGSTPTNYTYRASSTLFGCIFGTSSYTGSTKIAQSYYSSSSTSTTTSVSYYIPSGLTNLTITGTGNSSDYSVQTYAFIGCTAVPNVTLKGGTTKTYSFASYTGLKTFTYGASYTSIGDYMFYGDTGLTTVTVKLSSGAKIGSSAFRGCSSLKSVNIPDTVITIGQYAFYGCTSLPAITIPDSVTTIETYAFGNCSSISTITVPDSVTTIGISAFNGCSGLTEMTIPFTGNVASASSASTTTCFGYIFGTGSYTGGTAATQYYSGTSTTTNYIPTTLAKVTLTGTKLWYGAFSGCSKIQTINIPSSVISIPDYCFYGCSSLKQAPLPSKVTTIGNYAFGGCSALTAVTIPAGVNTLNTGVFTNCTGFKNFTIPAQILEIKDKAFYGCTGFTSFTVPATVSSIGEAAFGACTGLTEITVPFIGADDTASASARTTCFGYIFGSTNATGTTAAAQKYSTTSTTFYIPTSLTKINVTGGTRYLGAFSNLTKVEEIVLSNDVTYTADANAFTGCTSLKKVTLPAGTKSLGNSAFDGCTALTDVVNINSLTGVSDYAFRSCKALVTISLPETVKSINQYAFNGCTALKNITIPSAVTKITTYSFAGCSALSAITIPSKVTAIESYALYGCSSVKSLTIPDSVQTVATYAFSGMSGLTEMSIPFVGSTKGATTAATTTLFGYVFGSGSYTGGTSTKQFYGSSNYGTYYIPTALKTVHVRGGSILYGAFYGCSNITLLDIDSSVSSIGTNAFYNVGAIHYHGTLTSSNNWGAKAVNQSKIVTVTPSTCIAHGVGKKVCIGCDETIEENIELEFGPHNYGDDLICTVCGVEAPDPVWTMTSTSTYPWTQSGTTWKSSNYNKSSTSSSSTWTIELVKDISYTFQYRVISEANCDKLTITLDGTYVCNAISGSGSLTSKTVTLTKGTHTIYATYSKDSSNSYSSDTATLILPEITY